MILALVTNADDGRRFFEVAACASQDVIAIDLRGATDLPSRIVTPQAATCLLLALVERGAAAPLLLIGTSLRLTDLESRLVRHALESRVQVLALSPADEIWRVVGLSRNSLAEAQLEVSPLELSTGMTELH